MKIEWVTARKLTKNIKKLNNRFLDCYLALTSLIFNIFKSPFQIWIQHKISKKMMYNTFLKIFFSKSYGFGDLSKIKLSIRNHMNSFIIFFDCNIFWKCKNAATHVGGWLNSNIDHPYWARSYFF